MKRRFLFLLTLAALAASLALLCPAVQAEEQPAEEEQPVEAEQPAEEEQPAPGAR